MNAFSTIFPVKSMRDVKNQVTQALENFDTQDILLAFDIDMTLIQPLHPAAYYPTLRQYSDIYKAIFKDVPTEIRQLSSMLGMHLVPHRLVEKYTLGMISEFKAKKIKMIALTASFSGEVGGYQRCEVKRYQDLQKMNISFKDSFNDYPDIIFSHLKSYNENYPAFFEGILSSNGVDGPETKGSVLISFLEKVNIQPKVVIMVDDRQESLHDIALSLKEHHPDSQFIGIEYQGAFDYAPEIIDQQEFREFWQSLVDKAINFNEEK